MHRMSASAAALTNEEYDERKRCMEDLKRLVKPEQEQIYLILKKHKMEYSENTNGVFFDLSRLNKECFDDIKKFLTFCQANRSDFELRDKAMETSRLNLGDNDILG